VEHIRDAIDNRNILRDEKVCIGEYVGRRAAKISRSVKVQVPILLVLAYLLVCLIYPKAWLFFDWNPEYVKLIDGELLVLNSDSTIVWTKTYECDELSNIYKPEIGDIDGDGKNEIGYMPRYEADCDDLPDHHFFIYDDDGTLLFKGNSIILDEYPGDSTYNLNYIGGKIIFVTLNYNSIIVSHAYRSYPARTHIRIWDCDGKDRGWYINSGFVDLKYSGDFNGDGQKELYFGGVNNRTQNAVVFALKPDSSFGVSPPYTSEDYNLHEVLYGNQLIYIKFPQTDVLKHYSSRVYNTVHRVMLDSEASLRVDTKEIDDNDYAGITYLFNNNYELISAKANDLYNKRRVEIPLGNNKDQVPIDNYMDILTDSVVYWTHSGWSKYPPKNGSAHKTN